MERFDLRVGLTDGLVESPVEGDISFGEALLKMLLIEEVLRCLEAPKIQGPLGAFHDDAWAQAPKNARLEIVCWVQVADHDIPRVGQLSLTERACDPSRGVFSACETVPTGAVEAKYVTGHKIDIRGQQQPEEKKIPDLETPEFFTPQGNM